MSLKDKIVLVTGGTGSFGNFIAHRLIEKGVKEIRILSRDEKKQYDMRIHYNNNPKIRFFLGDIRDYARVEEAMADANIVYQAAALKQVPACEYDPMEAIKTNIVGVDNIIRAALKARVEKVITVSTDKAVKPVNVMGMSKALQERLILSANLSSSNMGTKLCVVRYGNVMRSRGSVIPYFRRLLSLDQTLTITDPEMTRFLLTLGDAIDLVFYATENTKGGETFVKKAPTSYVVDIAKVLSEEFGKKFEYKVIGKYPGEKLHEILISEEELMRTQDKGDYFVVHPWWEKPNYEELKEEYSSGNNILRDLAKLKQILMRADDEYGRISVEEGEHSKL